LKLSLVTPLSSGMALPSSLLSEEQFQCSICLDIFTNPVSTPCGHNFCIACIGGYWNSSAVCQCPLCKETFYRRPDLRINTTLREISEQIKTRICLSEECSTHPGEVCCDICTGRKYRAVKSCLVCLASYCQTHLEPHQRVKTLIRHKLIEPVSNIEDRLCKKHERVLELFCIEDQVCVCQFCTEKDHSGHTTVSVEEEYRQKRAQLCKTEAEVQQKIKDRLKKVEELRWSVELSRRCAQREANHNVRVFNALVRSIERSHNELLELIEKKQRVEERWAEGLIKELEQEITELVKRRTELEQLSHSEDHIHFLQSLPVLCPLPHTKDWYAISVNSDLCFEAVRRAVSQLEEGLREELEKLPEISEFNSYCWVKIVFFRLLENSVFVFLVFPVGTLWLCGG
ncbi:TRI47 protein, partial [Amia calva]|nr:TRI47 protein [Amia calva]